MENCLSLAKSSEFDIDQCIIYKKKNKVSLRSTENGGKKIIDAAIIRKDEVYQRLQNGNIDINFKYVLPIPLLLQKLCVEEDTGICLFLSLSLIYATNYIVA